MFMVLEVKRKEKQGSHILIRHFIRQVKQSGILLQARKIRFFERPKNKQARKRIALRKIEIELKRKNKEKKY